MISFIFVLSVFIASLFPWHTAGAQFSACTAALIPDVESAQSDERIRLTFLKTMTSNKFRSLKDSGGVGATIPVKGVPLNLYANWDQAEVAIQEETSRLDQTYSSSQATNYLRTSLSQISASAYTRCLELQSNGVFLWIKGLTSDTANVQIRWAPGPGQGGPQKIQLQLKGATTRAEIPEIWQGARSHTFIFDRKPREVFSIAVNLGGSDADILIPLPPRIAPMPIAPIYQGHVRDLTGRNPSTICLGNRVPWHTPAWVSMNGFWTGSPSGEEFNGPLVGNRVKIIARSAVTKERSTTEPYQHPRSSFRTKTSKSASNSRLETKLSI